MIRRGLGRIVQRVGRAIAGTHGVRGARGATKAGGPWRRGEVDELSLRRWEAADTNRLNQAQWQGARDVSLNQDLLDKLPVLRGRMAAEVSRNPILEGAIGMFCTDVSGAHGPTLQVHSDDDAYNAALEDVWRNNFWKCPDIAGQLGGVDFIDLWVRGLFNSGEFLFQMVTSDEPDPGPVSLRLKSVHPRRLDTDPRFVGDPDVAMGVRRTPNGRPIEYYIADPMPYGYSWLSAPTFTPVSADDMIHRFPVLEEDQVRGVPLLSSSLQSIADLREFDAQVLDAARQAADQAIQLYTDHPDAPFLEIDDTVDVERRTISTLPPGWKPWSPPPAHPAATYLDYRAERQKDIGRPVQMPGMMVRLDSSKHNYSSAKFDDQMYRRRLAKLESWLSRRTLDQLVDEVEREARLYANANPEWVHAEALRRRPRDVTYQWTWPAPASVDRVKEATGERTELENGTLSFSDACAAHGTDEDTQLRKLARTIKKFLSLKLPLPGWLTGQGTPGAELAAQLAAQEAAAKAADGDHEGAAEAADDAASLAAAAKPRQAGAAGGGSRAAGAVDPDQFKAAVDAYGVAVRSGSITPQIDDENFFREQIGLPAMSEAARTAWTQDKGVRRPITLASVADTRVADGETRSPTATEPNEDEQ